MYNLFFFVVFVILGTIGMIIPNEGVTITGFILYGLATVWLLISTISSFSSDYYQIERFERLRCYLQELKLIKDNEETLITQFKTFLSEVYPNLEEKIFNGISNNASLLKVKYPKIKSSKTISIVC